MLSQQLRNLSVKSRFDVYQNNPLGFVDEVIGIGLTDDQSSVMRALATEDLVSVKSGNGVGKTALAALAVLWFLYSYRPCCVLTTAPTERQVKELLWRQIRTRKAMAVKPLHGKALTMKLDLNPDQYALGFSTNDVQQMQGFHAPYIMVVIDEANGFPPELYEPILGILSGGMRKILFQIGNPIEPIGPFFQSFQDESTAKFTISCLNHPNVVSGKHLIPGAVTLEWVNRMRGLWGEDSAFWQSRVLGQFPSIATDIVVNLSWVENSEMLLCKEKGGEMFMGYDNAEYGNDEHVWYIGTKKRRVHTEALRNIEPAEGIANTKRLITKFSIKPENVTIEAIGAGATMYSVLKQDYPKIRGFVPSETAFDNDTFEDKMTEAWWNLRTLLNPASEFYENYSFCCKVDRLKADLCTRKFRTSRHGRYMLEPKPEYRKRMKRSPNYADAMALCYSPMSSRKVYGIVTLPNVIGY